VGVGWYVGQGRNVQGVLNCVAFKWVVIIFVETLILFFCFTGCTQVYCVQTSMQC
jgi:hypothetical protein